jgi:SAM-dependent methyltransferase
MTQATNEEIQAEVLEDLTQAVRYRGWLADRCEPWLGRDVLEVGSGLGDYAAAWASPGRRVTATEADPQRVAALRARFGADPRFAVRGLRLPAPPPPGARHSAVVALNVLEHIDDHVGALRSMRDLLVPGGRVVLVVPAVPLAMSAFDRDIGHVRRYTRRTLRGALEGAGLRVVRLEYLNSVGLLGWLVLVRALGGRPRDGAALRAYDRLVPLLRRAEALVPPPVGQSLFAVAERPPVAT